MEGTGTIDDPFRITNVTELQAVNNNLTAYYVLANDIDASDTVNWNGGKGFRPIGSFKGYFDGQGYSINNLTINDTSANPCGLFSKVTDNVNTYVKNVYLTNAYVRGGFYTGGLAGQAFGISAITNCHLSGTIIGDTHIGGLIGYIYITIPNIVNCSVNASISSSTTDSIVGGLIGSIVVGSSNRTMYIQKCKTNVNINSTSSRVGGLIGYIYQQDQYRINNKIYIQQCYSNGSLVNHTANTASRTGGFIGHTYQCVYTTNNYAYISDCYSRCSVDCDMPCRGSFIGTSDGGTDIRRCYATGFVTSRDSNYTKGFVGTQYRSTFADNYFDMETTGQTSGLGATGRTTAQMKTQSNYVGWDFENIWWIDEWVDYPLLRILTPPPLPEEGSGTIEDPYQIRNVSDLQSMNNNKSAYYILMNDIDASVTASWNNGQGFVPIGSDIAPFLGCLDGQGYTISNLTINRPTKDFIALFGWVDGKTQGYINNVNVKNCNIRGDGCVSILIGNYEGGSITNCHTSGQVFGNDFVSGFISWAHPFAPITISNCSCDVTISCPSTATALSNFICGIDLNNSDNLFVLIEKCYSKGNCSDGAVDTGGFIGSINIINSCDLSNINIKQCYSIGSITNNRVEGDSNSGGFIGCIYIQPLDSSSNLYIEDCYSRCDVETNYGNRGSFIGLIVGQPVYISRCYATGLVLPSGGNMGFIGSADEFHFADNYFDIETTGQLTGIGAEGCSTAQMKMQSTYTNWDFQAIWRIRENRDYPSLQAFPIEVITDIGEIIRLKSAICRTISLKSAISRTISLKSTTGTEEYEK